MMIKCTTLVRRKINQHLATTTFRVRDLTVVAYLRPLAATINVIRASMTSSIAVTCHARRAFGPSPVTTFEYYDKIGV